MNERKHTVYLALGSNLGDKNHNLLSATTLIAERIGVLSAVSSIYESEPWGFDSDNSFLNQVIKVETNLEPLELLAITQEIEKKIGRTEKTNHSYQDRIIDIDIILYNDLIYESERLTLPHPLYKERDFVMKPLMEIAPKDFSLQLK
jgi:2-amino-4-hydroxy-6-hydroxymethyldihydropteridine diphosphokinase